MTFRAPKVYLKMVVSCGRAKYTKIRKHTKTYEKHIPKNRKHTQKYENIPKHTKPYQNIPNNTMDMRKIP